METSGVLNDKGAILQSIGDAVITTDVRGRITLMNPVAERLTGWVAEEAEGKALTDVFRIVHGHTRIPAENPVERVMETGGIVGLANHTMLIARNGTTCQIADSGAPILDAQGRVAGVVLVFRDVTEEYRMREHLRQSEAFLKSLFESIQDGISALNPDLSIRHTNHLMKAWYAENLPLEGKKCFECYQNRDKPCDPCPSLRCLTSGKTEMDVVPGLPGSGVEWIELYSYPIRNEETGDITGVVEFVRDITERKKAEDALQAERRRLADVLEGTRAGIWEWNVRTGETVIDERWAEMVGYTLEELSPTTIETWQEMTHPADLEKAVDLLRRHLRGELDYYECEVRMRHKNGYWVWILDRGKVTKWMEDGRSLLVSGTHQEITKRKNAEKEREENERKIRTIVEHSNELFYIHDAKHSFTYVSPTSEALLGCSPEELRRKRFDMVTDNPINRKGLEITKTAIRTGEKQDPYLLEVERRDGSIMWLEVDESPVKDVDGNVVAVAGAARDVTAQRHAEERLKASEQRFRDLFNAISDVMYTHDLEGRFLSVNPALCSLFGYDEADVVGKKISEFMNLEDAPAFETEYLAQIKERGYHEGTSAYLSNEGKKIFIEYRNSMIYPESGAPYISGTGRDVTEKILSERKVANLQAHLAQAQKLESIGTLAGGIAHNFNNVLMGIQGRASLMMMEKDPSHPDYEHLKGIEEYVKNATELTRDLLGFARGGKYEVKPTDLNALIKHENRMFGRTKKEIRVHGKYEEDLWTVEVDQGQIRQVFLNLYVNAWQAMPGGGDLYLQTENVVVSKEQIEALKVSPGRYVKISIIDTGTGMDEATCQKVFDPFFSTKDTGRGSGLGLASVYGIIQNHGGLIQVSSEKGEGTTFEIYLPASDRQVEKESSEGGQQEIEYGQGTVLLVDDEEMILDVGRMMLEKLGYRVVTAGSGTEAIDLFENERKEIDLVILDMIMPGMGGGETYDQLKAIDPDVTVLLSSGYSINGQAKEIMDRGCSGFIQKPFAMDELSRKVKGVSDRDR